MPVTAKLSKAFYERLGEQIANELVDWFNAVDATYRADLKEHNEQNFARCDARLEQRLARIDARFVAFEARIDQRFAASEAKFDQRYAAFEVKIERRLSEQTPFLYLAWAAQMAAIVGFGTATISLLR